MTAIRTLHQSVLDLLRFPLAVIVVIVHTFSLDDVVASGITYHVSEYQLFQDVKGGFYFIKNIKLFEMLKLNSFQNSHI